MPGWRAWHLSQGTLVFSPGTRIFNFKSHGIILEFEYVDNSEKAAWFLRVGDPASEGGQVVFVPALGFGGVEGVLGVVPDVEKEAEDALFGPERGTRSETAQLPKPLLERTDLEEKVRAVTAQFPGESDNEMAEGDNPPIGLLLCTEKDHAVLSTLWPE